MTFKIKGARLAMLLAPALVLAAPAFAQVRAPTLADSQEPGSVIVFPKFIQGTVPLPEGVTAPITELEIGVVCPKGVVCAEHAPVKSDFTGFAARLKLTRLPALSAKKPTSTSPRRCTRKSFSLPTASRLALMPLVCRVNSRPRPSVLTAAGI